MRFGLVGTGPWAEMAHGRGLASVDEVEFVGVWGPHLDRALPLAQQMGVRAYDGYASLLRDVQAVAFTVPPDVQSVMATEAAKAGKHLLLEKPVATSVAAARTLGRGRGRRLRSCSSPTASRAPHAGGSTTCAGPGVGGPRGCAGSARFRLRTTRSVPQPGGVKMGALWDTGPHAFSTLSAALGPVVQVTATAGESDLIYMVVRHEGVVSERGGNE